MAILNCVSYNVKRINNSIKRKKLFGQLRDLQCSVALVHNTHLTEKEHSKLKQEWIDQVYSASCKNGKRRGIAVLFIKSVYDHNEELIHDDDGLYVMVVGTIEDVKVIILSLYAPNEDCPQFFEENCLSSS